MGNKIEINMERLNKWRNKWRSQQDVTYINTDSIVITHPVHLKTDTINFNGKINKLTYTNKGVMPLIVKELPDRRWQLLFGLKQLIVAKLLNLPIIPCIILRHITREDFIKYINDEHNMDAMLLYPIEDIKISQQFKNTMPSHHKIEMKRRAIEEGRVPLIVINKDKTLVDGYITYLLLKERGDENVMVGIV